MEILKFAIIIGFAVIGLQYIVGPVLVYFTQKFPKEFKFKLHDPEAFLRDRPDRFKDLHDTILKNSFDFIGSSELAPTNTIMYFSVYNNSDLKLSCTLSSAHTKQMQSVQIEFTQMYSDGSVMNVNNNPIFDVYPKNDQKLSFRFPHIKDFDQLFGNAKLLTNAYGNEKTPVTFEQGHAFATIESLLTKELDLLVNKGFISAKVINDERRLTPKGALLMTWKLCWPVKLFFNYNDIEFSKKALERISFEIPEK